MAFRWVEHTGELEVELEAESELGVFEAGLEAMRELLAGGEGRADREGAAGGERLEVEVDLRGSDRAALLADWLAELAFLGEERGLVPERLVRMELDGDALHATFEGREDEPPHLVKAATYHRLRFERADRGWRARVVLDV